MSSPIHVLLFTFLHLSVPFRCELSTDQSCTMAAMFLPGGLLAKTVIGTLSFVGTVLAQDQNTNREYEPCLCA